MAISGLLARARARANRTAAALFGARQVRMLNERPIVSFSFDDFPKSALRAADILSSNGAAGTFYFCSGFCGLTVERTQYYDLRDVQFLLENKHELGCHTASHLRVSRCGRDELTADLDRNAEFARRNFGHTRLATFSFPFGDISLSSKLLLQRRFEACRSSLPGINRGFADLGALRATKLYSHLIDAQGLKRLVEREARPGSWLIFYTHEVDENPGAFGCAPRLFEAAVRAALAAGFQALPVREAVEALLAGRQAPDP